MGAIKLTEIINQKLINNVINCNNIPGNDEGNIQNLLKKYNGKVFYSQINNFGRYYAADGLSLQNFQKDIRKYLSNGNYIDIDIVNCHPKLLEQLFIRYSIDVPKFLIEYNNNRNETITRYNLKDKLTFLIIINTEDNSKIYNKEIKDCHSAIYNRLLPELLKVYEIPGKDPITNVNGSKFAKIMQHLENDILQIMFKKCKELKVKVGVLVFDGMMIEKESCENVSNLINVLEKEVLEKLNFDVKIEEKSMETDWKPIFYSKSEQVNKELIKPLTNKSIAKLNKLIGTKNIDRWTTIQNESGFKSTPVECYECLANPGSVHDSFGHSYLFSDKDGKQIVKSCMTCAPVVINNKKTCKEIMNCLNIIIETQENNTYQELLENLLDICSESNYMREENTGIVYEKIKNYAYTRYLEPNKFLNKIFLDEKLFKSNVNNMDNMIKFMKSYNDRKFPFLEYNNDYLGFNNGVFNIITCEFYNDILEIDREKNGAIVRKYFDTEFDINNFATPLMDKVLDYQFSEEVRDFIYACLGRMFNIRDNFGFMLYLLGEASTGKSLIIDIISSCFENVGCINDGFETTFGLSSLYKKDIIVTDDLPKHISKIFPQQLFQSCITNGNVSISVKNGAAINMIWKIPMLWAGNYQVSYIDQGQISRRLLIANFEKLVYNPDTSLKAEIIKNELPAFINKCLHYYKKMVDTSNNKTIWQICPEYFLDQQEELKMERNPLYKFLMENTRYKENNIILMSEIKEEYNNWIGKKVYKLDNGTFPQVNKEYVIEKKNICKSCNKEANKSCCNEYNSKNRSVKIIVKNLEFLD